MKLATRIQMSLLGASMIACVTPIRIVTVSVSRAAEISDEYHDRVIVLGIKRPNETLHEVTGALIRDGAFVVTRRNETIALGSDDEVRLRIDYVDGDRVADGIVRAGISYERIGVGVGLGLVGTIAFIVSLVGGSRCGMPEPSYWFPDIGPAL